MIPATDGRSRSLSLTRVRRFRIRVLAGIMAFTSIAVAVPAAPAHAATIWTQGCVSGTAACLRFNQGSNFEYGYTNVPGAPSAHYATNYGGLIGVYQIRNRGYVNPFLAINSSFSSCRSRAQDSSTWVAISLLNGRYIAVGSAPQWGCYAV